MKKYMLMTAMVLVLAAPATGWSQNAPAGNPPPGNNPPAGGPGGGQPPVNEGRFEDRKAEILQRMNNHLAEVQKRISCVQAAQNHEQLRACLPERRGPGGERGEWGHREGGNGGGPPPGGNQ
jgi:hypothetical protein